uniref:Peptidase S9 prolyl oligopeptidase catalytic domain-containing protein n=1 Tax=Timema cristinae TaxID=61476 RepID=A0A7R9CEK0_TIMCR|nr:unnamed protein product [Timema cristinae]
MYVQGLGNQCLYKDLVTNVCTRTWRLQAETTRRFKCGKATRFSGKVFPDVRTQIGTPRRYLLTGGSTPPSGCGYLQVIDTSGDTKYPMLVYVYGGPNSNQINDAYTLSFGTYLATNRSIIYGLIDGRGSGLRGNKLLFSLNRKLGTVEIEDQIAVTRYTYYKCGEPACLFNRSLQQQLPYIDASRTAIWGWSYGGYATAMALAKDTEGVFKCGASVAPVSSWIYYGNHRHGQDLNPDMPVFSRPVYHESEVTETRSTRSGSWVYRLRKTTNPATNQSDVTRLIDNFKNKQFFLLHGNADDNVHYQQAMAIARSLQLADILFNQQVGSTDLHNIK